MTATGGGGQKKVSITETEDRTNALVSDVALSGTVTEDVPLGQVRP